MIPGVPVGTVCAYAGRVTPSKQGKNTIWSSTGCGAESTAGATSTVKADATAQDEAPVILIEAMGWMLCDGRSLGVAQYPELYKALGTIYGEGKAENGQTTFRIPDYRGLFLRGTDDGAGVDVDERSGPQGTGKATGVGSLQCDALQAHTHKYQTVQLAAPAQTGQAGAKTSTDASTGEPDGCRVSQTETRPKNIGVNYIIKYRSH